MTPSSTANDAVAVSPVRIRGWRLALTLTGVLLAMLLAALDQSIVGAVMPKITASLGGFQEYVWVFTAYMLGSTVTLPLWGKLSDVYGRRPFLVGGMVVFLIGSLLAGVCQNIGQLVIFRLVQGLGASAILPMVQSTIGDIFPPAERGKWQGLTMSVFGLASIGGPGVGGLIADTLGWRWIFLVNLPIGGAALVAVLTTLPSMAPRRQHRIDWAGAVLVAAWAVPLLLGFSWAGTVYSWDSAQVISAVVLALLLFGAFLVVERRAAEPIISPSFFRNDIVVVALISTFLVSVILFGALLYLPLFLQGVVGDSAAQTGLALLPMSLSIMVSNIIGGQIMARTGRYKLLAVVSAVLAAAGMVLLSLLDVHATDAAVIGGAVVAGLGIGVLMSLFTIVAQNAVPYDRLGEVTAGLQFFRSIGGTIGISALGALMTQRFQSTLNDGLTGRMHQALSGAGSSVDANPLALLVPSTAETVRQRFTALGPDGPALFGQYAEVLRQSLVSAIDGVFMVSAGAMLLAAVAGLFLREIALRKTNTLDSVNL